MNRFHTLARILSLSLLVSTICGVLYAQPQGFYSDTTQQPGVVQDIVQLTDSVVLGVGSRANQFYVARFATNETPDLDTNFILNGISEGELTHVAPAANPNRFFAAGPITDNLLPNSAGLGVLYLNQQGDTLWSAQYQLPNAFRLDPVAIGVDSSTANLQVAFRITDSLVVNQGVGQQIGIVRFDSAGGLVSAEIGTQALFSDSLPVVGRFTGTTGLRLYGVAPTTPAQQTTAIEAWEYVGQNTFQQIATIADDNSDGVTDGLAPNALLYLPDSQWTALCAARVPSGTIASVGVPQVIVLNDTGEVILQADFDAFVDLEASRFHALTPHPEGGYLGVAYEQDAVGVNPVGTPPGDRVMRLDDAFNVVDTTALLNLFGVTEMQAIGFVNGHTLLAGRLVATDATFANTPNTVAAVYIDTLTSGPIDACTYCTRPGDANQDSLANVYDLLYVAAGLNAEGPVDAFGTGLPAVVASRTAWNASFADARNYAFADADRNGRIELLDTLVISEFYGFDTTFVPDPDSSNMGVPPLQLNIPDTVALTAGDTLDFTVELGSPAQSVNDVLGMAFSLNYPKDVVKRIELEATGSWIGALSPPGGFADFQRTDTGHAQVDYGIFSTSQTLVSGVGTAASGKIIVTDNLDGKTYLTQLPVTFSHSQLIGANALPLPHRRVDGGFQEPTTRPESLLPQLSIYPNPSSGRAAVVSTERIDRVQVYAIDGRVIQDRHPGAKQFQLDDLPPGVLIVVCAYKGGQRLHQRLMVR